MYEIELLVCIVIAALYVSLAGFVVPVDCVGGSFVWLSGV